MSGDRTATRMNHVSPNRGNRRPVQVALLDYSIPAMDGAEVADAVQREPGLTPGGQQFVTDLVAVGLTR